MRRGTTLMEGELAPGRPFAATSRVGGHSCPPSLYVLVCIPQLVDAIADCGNEGCRNLRRLLGVIRRKQPLGEVRNFSFEVPGAQPLRKILIGKHCRGGRM